MASYFVRRIGQAVLVFLGVTFIIYTAVWLLPGDPIFALAGGQEISPGTIAVLRERYNLDDPLLVQYGKYLGGLLTGNLGTDFSGMSIADQLANRWPVTIQLALTAWAFQAIFGISLGTIAAVRHQRVSDTAILVSSMLFISIPGFVVAFVAQLVFGVRLGWFPTAGTASGWPMSYILPALVLATVGTAALVRLVRTSVIDTLRADFTRTAFAKGVPFHRILSRHVLRNSLIPAVTVLGIELGGLLSGAIIIEGIFNLPGIGQLLFQSVSRQEGVVVVTVASLLVLIFLVVNLVVDLLYGVLDPRVSHG